MVCRKAKDYIRTGYKVNLELTGSGLQPGSALGLYVPATPLGVTFKSNPFFCIYLGICMYLAIITECRLFEGMSINAVVPDRYNFIENIREWNFNSIFVVFILYWVVVIIIFYLFTE